MVARPKGGAAGHPTGQDDPSRTTDVGRPSLEMAFEIARVFDAPLDEVFQYPHGDD